MAGREKKKQQRSAEILFCADMWDKVEEENFKREVEKTQSCHALVIRPRTFSWNAKHADKMLTALARALQKRTSPLELALPCGMIGCEGAEALSEILSSPFFVATLDLNGARFRDFTPRSEHPLVQGLDENHGLARIEMGDALQNETLEGVCAEILSTCRTLVRVGIGDPVRVHRGLLRRIKDNREQMYRLIDAVKGEEALDRHTQTLAWAYRCSLVCLAQESPYAIAETSVGWNAFWQRYQEKVGKMPPRLCGFEPEMSGQAFAVSGKVSYLRKMEKAEL